jgi:DNA-binding CsgD family transcriptional regulator
VGLSQALGHEAERVRATRGRVRQFREATDSSVIPMLTVDNERRHVRSNAAARLLLRMSSDDLRGVRIEDLTPASSLPVMDEAWQRLLQTGEVGGVYEIEFPNDTTLPVAYQALANVLPGEHLIILAPAEWPADELQLSERQPGSRGPGPLTPREREVLTLIAAGADFRQIADALSISPATIKSHVRNAHRKLGARNRPHAIALALRRGLIDLPR